MPLVEVRVRAPVAPNGTRARVAAQHRSPGGQPRGIVSFRLRTLPLHQQHQRDALGLCFGRVRGRSLSYPRVIMDRMSGWHPMLLLTEEEPGMWSMKDGAELHPFGGIAIRRTEAGIRYKVALGNEIIGWATSLRVASERLWRAYLEQGRDRRAGPPNQWPK